MAAIFASHGEAAFRAAEKRAIGEALAVPRAVVATGGGAIVDAENRKTLQAAAPIVCLTARPEVILARAAAAGATRPLLQDADPAARLAALLAERAAAYAQPISPSIPRRAASTTSSARCSVSCARRGGTE